jgi:phytoene synthase
LSTPTPPTVSRARAVVSEQLRRNDRDRFIADLFAPEEPRRHLNALHAFDAEVARIRFAVSEPTLGEIRLQWWRDAIANRDAGGNPLAVALLNTIEVLALPVPAFLALLNARIFDLYNDPMPTVADFEGYAGETSSVLFQFAVIALGHGNESTAADAAGHAGVVTTLAASLHRFAADAERRQMFLPRDRFEAHGAEVEAVFNRQARPAVMAGLYEFRELARDHLGKAKRVIAALPRSALPAFLPLAVVGPRLARVEKTAGDPFAASHDLPRWRRQWLIWRAARRGLR